MNDLTLYFDLRYTFFPLDFPIANFSLLFLCYFKASLFKRPFQIILPKLVSPTPSLLESLTSQTWLLSISLKPVSHSGIISQSSLLCYNTHLNHISNHPRLEVKKQFEAGGYILMTLFQKSLYRLKVDNFGKNVIGKEWKAAQGHLQQNPIGQRMYAWDLSVIQFEHVSLRRLSVLKAWLLMGFWKVTGS